MRPRSNALNQEILLRLHESGVAAPSYTTLPRPLCPARRDHQPSQPAGGLRYPGPGGPAHRRGAYIGADGGSRSAALNPPQRSWINSATESRSARISVRRSARQLAAIRDTRRISSLPSTGCHSCGYSNLFNFTTSVSGRADWVQPSRRAAGSAHSPLSSTIASALRSSSSGVASVRVRSAYNVG